eukprot:PhM_4_TR18064/c1_g1_i12/m.101925
MLSSSAAFPVSTSRYACVNGGASSVVLSASSSSASAGELQPEMNIPENVGAASTARPQPHSSQTCKARSDTCTREGSPLDSRCFASDTARPNTSNTGGDRPTKPPNTSPTCTPTRFRRGKFSWCGRRTTSMAKCSARSTLRPVARASSASHPNTAPTNESPTVPTFSTPRACAASSNSANMRPSTRMTTEASVRVAQAVNPAASVTTSAVFGYMRPLRRPCIGVGAVDLLLSNCTEAVVGNATKSMFCINSVCTSVWRSCRCDRSMCANSILDCVSRRYIKMIGTATRAHHVVYSTPCSSHACINTITVGIICALHNTIKRPRSSKIRTMA